jgi:hypothetical protein
MAILSRGRVARSRIRKMYHSLRENSRPFRAFPQTQAGREPHRLGLSGYASVAADLRVESTQT